MGHRRDHYGTELHFGTGAGSHKSHLAITSQFGRFTLKTNIRTKYTVCVIMIYIQKNWLTILKIYLMLRVLLITEFLQGDHSGTGLK